MEDTLKINRRTMSGRIDKVISKYDKQNIYGPL